MSGLTEASKSIIRIEDNCSIHDKMIFWDISSTSFNNPVEAFKACNTMTNLLSVTKLDTRLLGKFKELTSYISDVLKLRINDYSNFSDNLDGYLEKHVSLFKKWSKGPDLDHLYHDDVYNPNIVDMTRLNEDAFASIFMQLENNEANNLPGGVYSTLRKGSISFLITEDIFNATVGEFYCFAKKSHYGFDYDLACSFIDIIHRFKNIKDDYIQEFREFEMTISGYNIEHLIAINILLDAYNALLDSESFRTNALMAHDKKLTDKRIDTAKRCIKYVSTLFNYRIERHT